MKIFENFLCILGIAGMILAFTINSYGGGFVIFIVSVVIFNIGLQNAVKQEVQENQKSHDIIEE